MDDNARPHRAAIVNETFQAHNIERMVWPACSPDANSIEHVWDRLQRQLVRGVHYPNTLNELVIALEEEWELIPQEYINHLIERMPNRCLAIWRARGGNTRFYLCFKVTIKIYVRFASSINFIVSIIFLIYVLFLNEI